MLDSRPLMQEFERPLIIIDSNSINHALSTGDGNAELLLSYHSQQEFDYARSPSKTEFECLGVIPEFKLNRNPDGNSTIRFDFGQDRFLSHMMYFHEIGIRQCAGLLFGKEIHEQFSEAERCVAELPIIVSQLNYGKTRCLLVTEDSTLLSNRMGLQSRFGLNNLFITDIEETRQILDAWSKHRGLFLYAPICRCNSGYWYWMSMRTKLRYYNAGDENIDALATRYEYILMAVDELTRQYYSGVNNDSAMIQVYHFNYLVSLIVGVFDSIALSAKERFEMSFERDDIPSRISLNSRSGKSFLKALRQKNPEFREHISKNRQFINGIYLLREDIIHRAMHPKVTFHMKGNDGEWNVLLLRVNKAIHEIFTDISSSKARHDILPAWGTYELAREYYIEPSRFSKASAKYLEAFINECLRILGFEDYLSVEKSSKQDQGFAAQLDAFRRLALAV